VDRRAVTNGLMQMWIEGQLQMGSSQKGSVFEELREVIPEVFMHILTCALYIIQASFQKF
jgi:hypothetical protein